MSNRAHSVREREICADILAALLDWIKPPKLIALGADAFRTLNRFGYTCTYVRHPSYGGKADFVRGVCDLYNLRPDLIDEHYVDRCHQ